ncbi:Unannotated, partial [Lentimonas sp. CC4]
RAADLRRVNSWFLKLNLSLLPYLGSSLLWNAGAMSSRGEL